MSAFKIAVCGRKGGVGKTTTSACLASYFASHGLKVLVVDLDPQSNTGFVLGVDPVAPGTAELILGRAPTPLKASGNLYVLPGGQSLQDQSILHSESEELAFRIKDFHDFGVIIFDCPPGSDLLERLGLAAANIALICTNAHPLGVIGAERVIDAIMQRQERGLSGPKYSALVLTQINRSRAFDKELPETLARKYPNTPQLPIRQNSDLAWATASRTPLMNNNPNSKSIDDIEKVARWVAQETVMKELNDG
ncbi:MAG: ParA family protein [Cyanobacteria bacterium P01_A01_bin.17]